MVNIGKLSATTIEQSVSITGVSVSTMIVTTDSDVEISLNDNTHYQTYKSGEIIPLFDRIEGFNKIYYKTLSGTANVRYWVS